MALFKRLNIDTTFLSENPSSWEQSTSYLRARSTLSSITVVNDTAERGVKLMLDFNGLFAANEEQKQYVLHCVEDHRLQYPDCKKATLKRKYDN